MNPSILFPYTADKYLRLIKSVLLVLKSNKDHIIDSLNNDRDSEFDIVLLEYVDRRIVFDHNEALCDMLLDYYMNEVDKESVFRQWEHFQGDLTFVVEGNQGAFVESWRGKALWLNPKRWLLVEYLIDCINKELNR